MGYVIAMAGKGGTGKTTIAALLIRLIKEKKLGSILAVDADPNSNLAEALGVESKETIGHVLDDICAHPDEIPAGMTKDRFIEYKVQTSVAEGEGFDVLTMGKPEGPGCYCYVNNVLRGVVGKLIDDYDFIIIDNEAGLEHLSRRTTRNADVMLVISDAGKVGLKAAKRINALTRELGIKIKKRLLIINETDSVPENISSEDLGLDCIGVMPLDKNITKAGLNGNSLFELDKNTTSLETLRKIGDKIWQRN